MDVSMVVGTEECPIYKITSILASSELFAQLDKKWTDVASSLGVSQLDIVKLEQDRLLDKSTLKWILGRMLGAWAADKGKKSATLNRLLTALKDNGLTGLAELLGEKLEVLANNTVQNYCRVPVALEDKLESAEALFMILATYDAAITCEKIRENSKPNCVMLSYLQLIDETSKKRSRTTSQQPTYILTDVLLEEIKRVRGFAETKNFKRVIIIVPVDTPEDFVKIEERFLKQIVWRDEMEWNDLSPKLQVALQKNLEDQIDVKLDYRDLNELVHGSLLVELINGNRVSLFKNTVPDKLSYYVPRTLTTRHILSSEKLFQHVTRAEEMSASKEIEIKELASYIYVGSRECPLRKVITTVTSLPSFPAFDRKWPIIAMDLGLSIYSIDKLKQNLLLDKSTLIEVVYELFSIWVSENGSQATLDHLLNAFEANGLKALSELLEDKFLTKISAKKFNSIPFEMEDFIKESNGQTVAVVTTPDCSITCQKIQESEPDFKTMNFEHFVNISVSSTTNYPYQTTIINDVGLEQIKAVVQAKQKGDSIKKLLILRESKEVLGNKYHGLGGPVIIRDEINWDALSTSYKFELKTRLENQLKMQFCVSDLKHLLSERDLVNLINGMKVSEFKDSKELVWEKSSTHAETCRGSILDDRSFKDIFVFTGIDQVGLSKLLKTVVPDSSSNVIQRNEITATRFIILDNEIDFAKICGMTKEPVHWLMLLKDGKIKWVESKGAIKAIQDIIDTSQENLKEDDVFQHFGLLQSNQPIFISDNPGKGKSVLLARIGQELKTKLLNRLVCFVPLSQLMLKLAEANAENFAIAKLEPILHEFSCQNKLEEVIFSTKLKSPNLEIELLLDGLDEVDHPYLQSAYDTLQILRKLPSTRIWVTTRLHLLQELESQLNVLAITIQPFSDPDKIRFLATFWLKDNEKLNQDRLEQFAQNCLTALQKKTASEDEDITGIPLQCYLLGEVFQETASRVCSPCCTSIIPNIAVDSIAILYEKIISKKINEYEIKFSRNLDKVDRNYLSKICSTLALTLLFKDKDEFQAISQNHHSPIDPVLLNIGILENKSSSSPSFIHRTFAEFFAADFIYEKLFKSNTLSKAMLDFVFQVVLKCKATQEQSNINTEISYTFANRVTCYFLNSLIEGRQWKHKIARAIACIAEDSPTINSIAYACANHNFLKIFDLFEYYDGFKKYQKEIFDENFLLNAILNCDLEFVEIAFNNFEKNYKFYPKLQIESLRIAAAGGNLSTVLYLVNKKNLRQAITELQTWEGTTLCDCVKNSMQMSAQEIDRRKKIVELLVDIRKDIMEERSTGGATPLLQHGVNLELVLLLIELEANVFAQDEMGKTIIHLNDEGSAHFSEGDYLKVLNAIQSLKHNHKSQNELKRLVRIQNSEGFTPLETAVRRMHLSMELIQKFREAEADFKSHEDQDSLVSIAIKYGRNAETLRGLVANGADIAWTENLLHLATMFGNKEAATFLITERKMDVNQRYWCSGRTPLDYVTCGVDLESRFQDYLETGKELLKLGGHFSEAKLIRKRSRVHQAVCKGNLCALKLLFVLDKTADANRQDKNGDTPLHLVAQNEIGNQIEIATYLIDKGADPNHLNNKREGPFQTSLKSKYLDTKTFKYLKSKNITKFTPEAATLLVKYLTIHDEIQDDEFKSIIEDCANIGADLNLNVKGYGTILHSAVRRKREKDVKLLLEKGVELNLYQDQNTWTPLHVLASDFYFSSDWNIMKCLINAGADPRKTERVQKDICLHLLLRENNSHTMTPTEFHTLTRYFVENQNYKRIFATKNKFGVTPLHLAVKRLVLKEWTINLLHKIGIDFNAANMNGDTVLYYAVSGGWNPKSLSYLIRHGANIECLTKQKESLLHCAARWGPTETVKFLLKEAKEGLDPNGIDSEGDSPLHWVLKGDDDKSKKGKIEALLSRKANIQTKNKKGQTPLDIAKGQSVNKEILQLLGATFEQN